MPRASTLPSSCGRPSILCGPMLGFRSFCETSACGNETDPSGDLSIGADPLALKDSEPSQRLDFTPAVKDLSAADFHLTGSALTMSRRAKCRSSHLHAPPAPDQSFHLARTRARRRRGLLHPMAPISSPGSRRHVFLGDLGLSDFELKDLARLM